MTNSVRLATIPLALVLAACGADSTSAGEDSKMPDGDASVSTGGGGSAGTGGDVSTGSGGDVSTGSGGGVSTGAGGDVSHAMKDGGANTSPMDGGTVVISGDSGADLGCGPGSGYGLTKTNDPVRAFAEKEAMAALQRWVGRFYDGTSPAYDGVLQAHDNQSVFPGYTDRTIPTGHAIADIRPYTGGAEGDGLSFFAYSDATEQFVQLQQPTRDPSTTNVFMILARGMSGGRYGACKACAPSFASHPTILDLRRASATYDGEGATAPLEITVTATFTVMRPCDLKFADIVRLNSWQRLDGSDSDAPIEDTGVEVVHSGGRYGPPPTSRCDPGTPYTIDLFVDRAQPWIFGIGNYEAGAPSAFCPP